MKILIRFFYNNDYRFSITFLCHTCLGEHDKKSQMKFNQLPNYAENFREDSAKILLYQWIQVLYYFSSSPLPMGTREKIVNKN